MHYEDQSRRFNVVSGFLLGVLLGTGAGLLRGPIGRVELPRRRRSRRERVQRFLETAGSEAGRALVSKVREKSGR